MKHYSELPDIKPTHAGCVILGNSGSLLDTPFQDDWNFNGLVIGLNRILRVGLDGRMYQPDLMFVTDGRPMTTDRDLIKNYGQPLVAPEYCYGDIYQPDENSYLVDVQKRSDVSHRHEDALGSCANVAFQAIQFAYILGYRQIYLLGCEGRWPDNGRPSHFYDKEMIEAKGNLRPFKLSKHHNAWMNLKRSYQDAEILNLTPWQDASVLPFDFADASIL